LLLLLLLLFLLPLFAPLFLLFPLLCLLLAQLMFSVERFLSPLLSAQYLLPLRQAVRFCL
jgi:hypothetical protein